jgi:hypothetical protein
MVSFLAHNRQGTIAVIVGFLILVLSLWAVVLVLPASTTAQCEPQLTVQDVLTQDAGGTEKTTFAPGETIRFVAEVNNAYGGWMLGANGTELAITTSFYSDTASVDIPPGSSTWTWEATTPSTAGDHTVEVRVYDHFCGISGGLGTSFIVGEPEETPPPDGEGEPGLVANAGPDQTVPGPSPVTVQLDGSGSTGDIVRYQWYNQYGLLRAEGATPVIEVNFGYDDPQPGTARTFTLVVEDSQGNTAQDEVSITLGETEEEETPPPEAEPSLNPQVRALQFYESGYGELPPEQRVYDQRFAKETSRYINWALDLAYEAPGSPVDFKITAIYLRDTGASSWEEINRYTVDAHVEGDQTGSSHWSGYGCNEPEGCWEVGSYRVDIYFEGLNVDGQLIASEQFEIYGTCPEATVTISPSTVKIVDTITMQGEGWYPGGTVTITAAGPAQFDVGAVVVPDSGAWETSFTIPDDAPPGHYQMGFSADHEGCTQTVVQPFTIESVADTEPPTISWVKPVPNLWVQVASSGTVELEVTASDSSGIRSVVFFRDDAVNKQAIEITTDSSPPYQASVEVNTLNMKWNEIFVIAEDTADNWVKQSIFIYRVMPTITLNTAEGLPNTKVIVQGSGWLPEETVILNLGEPANKIGQATVDDEGNFETTFTVPPNAAFGEQKVIAITANGFWGAEAVFRVQGGQPPAAPSTLKAEPITSQGKPGTQLSWTDTADNEDGYRVVDQNRPQEYEAGLSPGTGSTVSITLPFASGCFRVYAYNKFGRSPLSEMVCTKEPGRLRVIKALEMSGTNPLVWESVTASFTVKNVGGSVLHLEGLAAAARRGRDWNGAQADFPHASNITLQPNEEYVYNQSHSFAIYGKYFAEPVMKINGKWVGIANANRINFTVITPMSVKPEGKARNLVVYVHGCCTDANGFYLLRKRFEEAINQAFLQKPPTQPWEIVVWDWTKCTPDPAVECTPVPPGYDPDYIRNVREDLSKWWVPWAGTAYKHADEHEGQELADAINQFKYKHIHLIGHSAGSKLINRAAERLSALNQKNAEKPFIHLTFLDAYTPNDNKEDIKGKNSYGSLPDYPNHYSEHYVHKGLLFTNAPLKKAFNFDITGWKHTQGDGFFGHDWPVNWYIQSIITTPEFNYGFPLSLEGSNNPLNGLDQIYPPGGQCALHDPGISCLQLGND